MKKLTNIWYFIAVEICQSLALSFKKNVNLFYRPKEDILSDEKKNTHFGRRIALAPKRGVVKIYFFLPPKMRVRKFENR
jgi:hypothetical protein